MPFQVQQIDHVEIFVPDQYEAAQWFEDVLGLKILSEHEHWAHEGGPLMISSDSGNTMIALFNGEPQSNHPVVGPRRVAFRTDSPGFLMFLNQLDTVIVQDTTGQRVSARDVVDHDKAWSIYFKDPYGNLFEVTTYDYDDIQQHLA